MIYIANYLAPQRSNPGPLLFIFYNNDLTNVSEFLNFVIIADGTTALPVYENKSTEELQKLLNSELKKLSGWFKTNRLSLNISKSCYVPFHTSKSIIYQWEVSR